MDIFTSLASHWKLKTEPGSNFSALGKIEYVSKNLTGEKWGAGGILILHIYKNIWLNLLYTRCVCFANSALN